MMNCSCSICCSRLEPSDDVFSTTCGHIFHFPCLTQWLERSKTCPQCREKTHPSKIHRLYFNVLNNESIKEDSTVLQERIDNLRFQMLLRDKDVTDFKSKATKLQSQMVALRSEVLKLEAEIEHKNSAIYALKEQAKYYKQTHDEGKKYKEQAELLQNTLNNLKDIQVLLSSANDEADELVSCTADPKKLATYISVLKRELTVGMNNRKRYQIMIRHLKHDLNLKQVEITQLNTKINKMKSFEQMALDKKNQNTVVEKNRDDKQLKNNIKINVDVDSDAATSLGMLKKKIKSLDMKKQLALETELDDGNEENCSTNQRYKIQALIPDNKRKVPNSNSGSIVSSNSILAKKPRLAHDPSALTRSRDGTYAPDGLGGFAKVEQFPKATVSSIKKKTNSNSKTSNNRSHDSKTFTIDNFVDLST